VILCFRKDVALYSRKFVPLEHLKSYWLGIRMLFTGIFDSRAAEEMAIHKDAAFFGSAMGRLKTCLMTFSAGAGLAISGSIFQTTYKNPMASPNILGVTAGVSLGNIVIVLVYSTQALLMIYARYRLCYIFTAACVVLVLLLGRLAGNKKQQVSIMEMVMVGAIVSQLINAFVQYYMYTMEDEQLEIYEQLTLGAVMNVDAVSFILFISVMAVSVIPMLIFRYRLNILGMDHTETVTVGVNAAPWRVTAQICGVLMSTAAMIHCGQVGMITMVVPYIVRRAFGSDFRRLCVYSALIGGLIVMTCQFGASFFMINDTVLPAGFFVNFITTPAFMVILATQRRRTDAA